MNNEPIQQPAGLIGVLLDPTARLDERDDAAIDLARFDAAEALAALISVARNPNEASLLLDSCCESIAEIWIRAGTLDEAVLDNLADSALSSAVGTLKQGAPSLLPESRRR